MISGELLRDVIRHSQKTGNYRWLARRFNDGIQNVHTPYDLCSEIISKLKSYTTLYDKQILVLFNLEFVAVLVEDFGVNPKNITYASDGVLEKTLAKAFGVNVIDLYEIYDPESKPQKSNQMGKKDKENYEILEKIDPAAAEQWWQKRQEEIGTGK